MRWWERNLHPRVSGERLVIVISRKPSVNFKCWVLYILIIYDRGWGNVLVCKKNIDCYRVESHQLSHDSQTIPHCAACQAPERDVEPRLKKLNKICKSRHITWSRGNSEGCPRKIWKPPSSEKTEPSLTLQNNNYCNNIESGTTIKQNTKKMNRTCWSSCQVRLWALGLVLE